PRAVIDCGLRIRTEWASARRRCADLRENAVGRHAVLHPVHERVEQVLRLRPAAATAVRDTGGPAQATEARQHLEGRRLARAMAGTRRHLTIVVNDAVRRDQLVVAADEGQQFAAVAPEHMEIPERVGTSAMLREPSCATCGYSSILTVCQSKFR